MNYKRISKYYPGCDGTKLAVDLYLPETEEKVPVLLKAGYMPRRMIESEMDAVEGFLNEGYAVAIVEVRGSGASYGVSDGFFTRKDARDMAALIDQMTHEEWCSGKAGMYGGSNVGMIQEITACEQPENLYAVIPCDCSMDLYYQNYPNGVSAIPDFPANHHQENPLGIPVDDDPAPDYPMAHEAAEDQKRNKRFLFQYMPNMYRDDLNPNLGYRPNLEIPAWERMDAVRFGHVKTWSTGAWFDPGCTNKILTYKSWGGKLLLGPWPHCGIYSMESDFPNGTFDWPREYVKFFDATLKGKKEDYLEEPPVRYYTIGDEGHEWHYEADFPVAGTNYTKLCLSADGELMWEADGATAGEKKPVEGSVPYRVRNDIMIYGPGMRMNRNVEKDMTPEDEKSLVFTSEKLPGDMEITGIPSMEIYVTSTHTDGNFIVVLEEVTEDGVSHFLTEGMMRASHAKEHMNGICASMGLAYHRGYREDKVEMSVDQPLKLSFRLEALSRIIKKGSRLRIAVSCGGSGFGQPEGFPAEMPEIKLYTGGRYHSEVTLPIVKPTATEFVCGDTEVYAYKKAVYIKKDGTFKEYPCVQVYPIDKETLAYVTEAFTLKVHTVDHYAEAKIEDAGYEFAAEAVLKERYVPVGGCEEVPLMKQPWNPSREADVKNLYVATVPVAKGDPGNMNPQLRSTLDLYIDMIYPKDRERKNLPCIINVHGFGGNHTQFETNTDMFLELGCAVASIDYRLCPPNVWPASDVDAKGCIRYLKAHAEELGLDRDRFAVVGGSMGGNLTGMIAAINGDPAYEGNIGGNTEYDSSVKAAASAFGFYDYFHFGEDSAEIWPAQPDKVNQSDGPFAPLASLMGHVGPGKGMADIKHHLYDPDPKYQELIRRAIEASPISHVTEKSAPLCLIHGIFDCGIQVPMGQSVRMFTAYSRKGVKSLLLCNNNGIYGEDPEVKKAVVDFIMNRL